KTRFSRLTCANGAVPGAVLEIAKPAVCRLGSMPTSASERSSGSAKPHSSTGQVCRVRSCVHLVLSSDLRQRGQHAAGASPTCPSFDIDEEEPMLRARLVSPKIDAAAPAGAASARVARTAWRVAATAAV